jgi:peptidoglycan/LPS O-acetylase OafA/YrhL
MARLFERIAPAADMTYSSYLVHFPIQIAMVIVTDRLGYGRLLYNEPWMLAIFLGLVFSSAWWVHHGFERPAQSLIRRVMSTAGRQKVVRMAA